MLNPSDRWIWDFWHVEHAGTHHLYYLQAPKTLGDPDLRHRNATIGHATSDDLRTWTEHGTILEPGGSGAADATATWTGSVVRGGDGLWRMFYTGASFLDPESNANIETILVAVSDDLHRWRKDPSVVLRADARHYEVLGTSSWPEEAWRDPWVYQDQDGHWHMLITARATSGPMDDRGVIGYALSQDLHRWNVQPPLTSSGAGFAQLEVLQQVTLGDRDYVVFSTHRQTLTEQRRRDGDDTGTWIAPIDGHIRLEDAVNLTGPRLYSGRIIHHDGQPVLLAFRTEDTSGAFLGGINDPIPISVRDGRPTLAIESSAGADS